MAAGLRAIGVVLLLVALAYILYLWSRRRDMIACPECGADVDMYAEECPHCGHAKTPLEEHDHAKEHDREEVDEKDYTKEEVEEDAYTCDECGKTFDSERGLNVHTGMKH